MRFISYKTHTDIQSANLTTNKVILIKRKRVQQRDNIKTIYYALMCYLKEDTYFTSREIAFKGLGALVG